MKKPTPLNVAGAAALVIVLAACSSDCESTRSCGTYTPTDGGKGGATGGTQGSGGGGTGASGGMSTGGGSGTTNGGGGGGAVAGDGGSAGMGDGAAGEPGIKDAGPDVLPDTRPPCDATSAPSDDACVIDEKYAVFVSPNGSDATGDGTRKSPYATIGKGVASAQVQSLRVYACATAGAFAESLTFDGTNDGAALFGGFDCDTWAYVAGDQTTVKSATTIGLKATGLVAGLRVEDVDVSAVDATEPGGSSYGALVSGSKNVVFRRVKLTAGKGAKGADGTGSAMPAFTGATGNDGTAACIVTGMNAVNLGGAAVETMCGGAASGSTGGRGGDGGKGDISAGSGNPGLPTVLGKGLGGGGETNPGWDCSVGTGTVGANGTSQPTAAGASSTGTLSKSGYVASDGANGLEGTAGQGGGGGGGAKAPTSCGTNPRTGASAGSGGGGGCGGKGGTGGKGGGASIALASVDASIELDGCDLTAQAAGAGGKGGGGQQGGGGGDPGHGKTGPTSDSCDGGKGGRGGNGGNAGGGAGGPSLAIAHTGAAPVQMNTTAHFSATPAPGGADGAGLTTGAGTGTVGLAASVSSF